MELNIVEKNPLRVKARVAYIYPSVYRAMISGLSHDIIYHLANSIDEVYLERFCNARLSGEEPEPRSIETRSRLRDFPLMLVSLHYEPDVVNLARLLIAGGVELFASKREQVIVAGGPAVMENPIPYSDIVDAFIIGEAEVTVLEILAKWLEYGDSKERFLEEISSLPYVYVPALQENHRVVKRAFVEDLSSSFYPVRQVENTEIEPVYGRGFKLEVSRGCRFWCGFCIETRVFQPYRERDLPSLKKLLEEGLSRSTAGKRVVLFSLSFPTTKTHYELLEFLVKEGYRASLPSLRVSPLLEKSLELIKALGQRTIAIAPESFSITAQRCFFKYPGVLDYVKSFIERAIVSGFDLKIYLVYGVKGLPLDVVREDVEYLSKIAKLARMRGQRLSISLNPLIPKPHTPFQWIGMQSRERLVELLKLYKSSLKGAVEARVYDIDWAVVQAQLSLSPSPLGRLIYRWSLYGGGLGGWRRAVREEGLNYRYVFEGYRREEPLPWGFIDHGATVEKVNIHEYEALRSLLRF